MARPRNALPSETVSYRIPTYLVNELKKRPNKSATVTGALQIFLSYAPPDFAFKVCAEVLKEIFEQETPNLRRAALVVAIMEKASGGQLKRKELAQVCSAAQIEKFGLNTDL